MRGKTTPIDEYLARVGGEQRAALEPSSPDDPRGGAGGRGDHQTCRRRFKSLLAHSLRTFWRPLRGS